MTSDRITDVTGGPAAGTDVTLARYDYLGRATVAQTEHPEPGLYSGLFERGDPSGTYDHLDVFNRVTRGVWMLDRATDRVAHDVRPQRQHPDGRGPPAHRQHGRASLRPAGGGGRSQPRDQGRRGGARGRGRGRSVGR